MSRTAWMLSLLVAGLSLAAPRGWGQSTERAPAAAAQDSLELRALLTGNGLLARGLVEPAAQEYRAFLKDHPGHARASEARYGLAVCLFRGNELPAAGELLAGLAGEREFEFAAEVLAMLGQCRLAEEKYDEAAATFARLLKQHGEHALADDAAALLIEARYRAGEHGDAAKLVGLFTRKWETSALKPRVLLYGALAEMARGDWAAAGERLDACLGSQPDSDLAAQARFLRARCRENSNELTTAADGYRELIGAAAGSWLPEALLGLARVEQRRSNFDEAAALIDRLVREFPEHPDLAAACLLRGRASFEAGRAEEAAGWFARAVEREARVGDEAAYWLAKCEARQGRAAEAAARLERALRDYPQSALLNELRYDRAAVLAQSDQADAAAAAVDELLGGEVDPGLRADALVLAASVAHRRGDYAASAARCDEFLAAYPQHAERATLAFLAAENAYLRGDLKDAAARFDALRREVPDHARRTDIEFRLGMALYRLGDLAAAAEVLRAFGAETGSASLAGRGPQHHAAHLALGEIAFERGEWTAAEAELRAYLEQAEPATRPAAQLKLGLVLQRQERFAEAVEQFSAASAADAPPATVLHARFERGQALVALQRDAEAEPDLKFAAESGDERFRPHALNHLAQIALRRNDLGGARQLLGEASASPEFAAGADAQLQIGQVLLAQGKFEEAEAALRTFAEGHPEHPLRRAAVAQIALAVARQGRGSDALELFAPLVRNPKGLDEALQAALWYEQALAFKALGQSDEARESLRRMLELEAAGQRRAYALAELAELEAAAGDCAQAAERLTPLLAADSEALPALQAQARYRLGLCRFQQEDFESAARLLDEYLQGAEAGGAEAGPAASAAYFCGEALFRLGRFADAARRLERVVERPAAEQRDAFEAALLRLGECHAQLQQWEASEQVFARHRAEFAGSPHAYQADFGVGWARENAGRPAEALEAYRRVTASHTGPTAARAQFQIGECLFALKQLEDAVRELLKVDILYQQPEWSAAALFEAGRCLEQMGQVGEARQQYEQVVSRFADSKWSGMARERLSQAAAGVAPGRAGQAQASN